MGTARVVILFVGRARAAPDRAAQGGFTLLEITVALAVMVVAILPAAALVIHLVELVRDAREVQTAGSELAAAVETVVGTPYSELRTRFPDGEPIPGFEDRALRGERITVTYADPEAPTLEITLAVSWVDGANQPRGGPLLEAVVVRTR